MKFSVLYFGQVAADNMYLDDALLFARAMIIAHEEDKPSITIEFMPNNTAVEDNTITDKPISIEELDDTPIFPEEEEVLKTTA